jgi:hypothetical protein
MQGMPAGVWNRCCDERGNSGDGETVRTGVGSQVRRLVPAVLRGAGPTTAEMEAIPGRCVQPAEAEGAAQRGMM